MILKVYLTKYLHFMKTTHVILFRIQLFFVLIVLLFSNDVYCQVSQSRLTKGSFYGYWGYNQSAFTKSNLRLVGVGYDFTMKNLKASDNPEKFNPNVYFNLKKMTIPQFNLRVGYFISDNWSLSFGYDHMKYVMNNNQLINLHGHIDEGVSDQWAGDYNGETKRTNNKFIHYENSDGLNYMRIELTNYHELLSFGENKWLRVNSQIGFSSGFILSFNDFNFGNQFDRKTVSISGYGVSLSAGVRLDFFNRFFLQSNIAGGMMHQLKVRTRPNNKYSHAKQVFGYIASEVVLGYAWKF